MKKFKKQNAPRISKKKKKSKGCCFIVKKFQIINIGEGVKLYSTFKIYILKSGSFFHNILNKICLKVGKIKNSEFQKLYVRRPGNRKQSFFHNLSRCFFRISQNVISRFSKKTFFKITFSKFDIRTWKFRTSCHSALKIWDQNLRST